MKKTIDTYRNVNNHMAVDEERDRNYEIK